MPVVDQVFFSTPHLCAKGGLHLSPYLPGNKNTSNKNTMAAIFKKRTELPSFTLRKAAAQHVDQKFLLIEKSPFPVLRQKDKDWLVVVAITVDSICVWQKNIVCCSPNKQKKHPGPGHSCLVTSKKAFSDQSCTKVSLRLGEKKNGLEGFTMGCWMFTPRKTTNMDTKSPQIVEARNSSPKNHPFFRGVCCETSLFCIRLPLKSYLRMVPLPTILAFMRILLLVLGSVSQVWLVIKVPKFLKIESITAVCYLIYLHQNWPTTGTHQNENKSISNPSRKVHIIPERRGALFFSRDSTAWSFSNCPFLRGLAMDWKSHKVLEIETVLE